MFHPIYSVSVILWQGSGTMGDEWGGVGGNEHFGRLPISAFISALKGGYPGERDRPRTYLCRDLQAVLHGISDIVHLAVGNNGLHSIRLKTPIS